MKRSSDSIIKMWGTTQTLASNPYFTAHILNIKAKGYSSKHYHQHKYNLIHVYEGELKISIFGDEPKQITLSKGEQLTIDPAVMHQFYAITDTLALEFYWPYCPTEDDIIRVRAEYDDNF